MTKQIKLETADRNVKDLEIRLRTSCCALTNVETEIEGLEAAQKMVESNIQYLKKHNIVTMATEFKKAKEELAKIKTRLGLLLGDSVKIHKACESIDDALKSAKAYYNKILKESTADNIVRLNFRKKNDR